MHHDDSLNVGLVFLGFLGLSVVSGVVLVFLAAFGLLSTGIAGVIVRTWVDLSALLTLPLFVRYRSRFLGTVTDVRRAVHPQGNPESGLSGIALEVGATMVLVPGTVTVLLLAESWGFGYGPYFSIAEILGWDTVFGVSKVGATVLFVAGWLLWGFAWVAEGLRVTENG